MLKKYKGDTTIFLTKLDSVSHLHYTFFMHHFPFFRDVHSQRIAAKEIDHMTDKGSSSSFSGQPVSFESVLEKEGTLLYKNKGTSMLPLIRQDRDLMLIARKGPERCRRLDAVLFRRDNGQYVLHRILKVRPADYWVAGDNCSSGEYVREDQILGILTAVIRDGKQIRADAPACLLYVHLLCDLWPARMLLFRIRDKAGSLFRKASACCRTRKKRNG